MSVPPKFEGYVDPKEELLFEPMESRVDKDLYQAEVPEFDSTQIPKRYDVHDIHCPGIPVPKDILFLHQSVVFLPGYVEGSNESLTNEFIEYVQKSFGATSRMHTNFNEAEETALNLITRFNGDVKQARLYFDSVLGSGAGQVACKIEDVHGGDAKQGIHYHIAALGGEDSDSTQKQWSKWREEYQIKVDHKPNIKDYEELLRSAQQLFEMYGNPSSRIFSLVCRVKNIINAVNEWRSKVHDHITSKEAYTNEELLEVLHSYPHNSPKCDEYKVFEDMIKDKKTLEKETEDTLNNFCSMSCMQQLLDRINKFEFVVMNKTQLLQKMKLLESIEEQIQLFIEPYSPDQDYPALQEAEALYDTIINKRLIIPGAKELSLAINEARHTKRLLHRGIVLLSMKQLEDLQEQLLTSRIQQFQELYDIENRLDLEKEFMEQMNVLLEQAHKPYNPIQLEELQYVPGKVFHFSRLEKLYDKDTLTREKMEEFIEMMGRAQLLREDFAEIYDLYDREKEWEETLISAMSDQNTEISTLESLFMESQEHDVVVPELTSLAARIICNYWNQRAVEEVQRDDYNMDVINLMIEDVKTIEKAWKLKASLRFTSLNRLQKFSDQTREWFESVRKCLRNKGTIEEARKLLLQGQSIGADDNIDYKVLEDKVREADEIDKRIEAVSSMNRIPYEELDLLKEKCAQLSLKTSHHLPAYQLKRHHLDWRRWAQEFLSIYPVITHRLSTPPSASAIVSAVMNSSTEVMESDKQSATNTTETTEIAKDGNVGRKSYEKMCGKLEDQMRGMVLFEKEEDALTKIRWDHENWLRECRYLLFCCREDVMANMKSFLPESEKMWDFRDWEKLGQFEYRRVWGETDLSGGGTDDWVLQKLPMESFDAEKKRQHMRPLASRRNAKSSIFSVPGDMAYGTLNKRLKQNAAASSKVSSNAPSVGANEMWGSATADDENKQSTVVESVPDGQDNPADASNIDVNVIDVKSEFSNDVPSIYDFGDASNYVPVTEGTTPARPRNRTESVDTSDFVDTQDSPQEESSDAEPIPAPSDKSRVPSFREVIHQQINLVLHSKEDVFKYLDSVALRTNHIIQSGYAAFSRYEVASRGLHRFAEYSLLYMNDEDSLYRINRIVTLLKELANVLDISLPQPDSSFKCGAGITIDGKPPSGIDIMELGAIEVVPKPKKTYRKNAEEIIRTARETLKKSMDGDENPLDELVANENGATPSAADLQQDTDAENIPEYPEGSFTTLDGESIPYVSLNTLYLALKVSSEFRIEGAGEQFPWFFRCLISSLYEELYVNQYLLGAYYRQRDSYSWHELADLNELFHHIRCVTIGRIKISNSLAIINKCESQYEVAKSGQSPFKLEELREYSKNLEGFKLKDIHIKEVEKWMEEADDLVSRIGTFLRRINRHIKDRDRYLSQIAKLPMIDLHEWEEKLNKTVTNYCLCHSTREDSTVICPRCNLVFHCHCLGVSPDDPTKFVCPICICTQRIELLVDKARNDSSLSLQHMPITTRQLISTAKHPLVVTVHMNELRKAVRESAPIQEYTSLTILPTETEQRTGRRMLFRDPKMREFFATLEMNARTPADQWKVSILETPGNIDALRSVRIAHFSSLREWFLHANYLFKNPAIFLSISFPNRQQTLPGEFLFLIEESLRLGVSSISEVNNMILIMLNITFFSVVRSTLQSPREFSEWKWIDHLRETFSLEGDDCILRFVKRMVTRCEEWMARANQIISSKQPIENEKAVIDDLIHQAMEIPVQMNELRLLESIVEDNYQRICFCNGFRDGSQLLTCRICRRLFHSSCVERRMHPKHVNGFICSECRENDYRQETEGSRKSKRQRSAALNSVYKRRKEADLDLEPVPKPRKRGAFRYSYR